MKIPSSIRWRGHTFNIKFVESFSEQMGQSRTRDNEVRIASDIPLTQQEHTFIHELVHLTLEDLDFDGNYKDVRETIVNMIGSGLHDIITNNPEIFEEVKDG